MLQDRREVTGPRQAALGLAAIGVAFATMTYELTLAQSLTSIYGNTVSSYSLVIGFFVLSLGLGAAYWAKTGPKATARTFWSLEMGLAVLGALAPVIVFRAEFGGAGTLLGGALGTVLLAFCIGCLAGMEIPLLVALATEEKQAGAVSFVLGLDFVGTFIASILVPLWLFPDFGLIGTSLVGSFVNLAMAALVLVSRAEPKPARLFVVIGVFSLLVAWAMHQADAIESYLAKGVF